MLEERVLRDAKTSGDPVASAFLEEQDGHATFAFGERTHRLGRVRRRSRKVPRHPDGGAVGIDRLRQDLGQRKDPRGKRPDEEVDVVRAGGISARRGGAIAARQMQPLQSLEEIPEDEDLLARESPAPHATPSVGMPFRRNAPKTVTVDRLAAFGAEERSDRLVERLVDRVVHAIADHDRLPRDLPTDPRRSRRGASARDEPRLGKAIEPLLHRGERTPRPLRERLGLERPTRTAKQLPQRERVDVAEHVGQSGFTEVEGGRRLAHRIVSLEPAGDSERLA